ncbi:MAG: hypothetical protein E7408_07200 [Ruminococcaceae bacterium]|nr:hypothetical protein [Oscillospiraceae bacterium]
MTATAAGKNIRNAATRDEGTIRFDWLLDGAIYDNYTDLEYKWTPQTQVIGVNTPSDTSDDAKWQKMTYEIIIPPNANGFRFVLYQNDANGKGVFDFLFHVPQDTPLGDLPEDTSLRKAIKAHYLGGGHIWEQGGLLFLK